MQILPEACWIFIIIIYTLGIELFLSIVNEQVYIVTIFVSSAHALMNHFCLLRACSLSIKLATLSML